MKVKELINALDKFDRNKELILYVVDNSVLHHTKIETMLDVDDRIELTVYSPADMENE